MDEWGSNGGGGGGGGGEEEVEEGVLSHSYLYCMDRELGWGNRTYFTFFSHLSTSATLWSSSLESVVLVLLFVLSSVANVLVFYTLSSTRRLRTVTNYFVCNLTLADLCFTLCCPLVAVTRVTGSWVLGSFACKTVVYMSCVCGFVTIWTLTLISVDRYSCIVRGSKSRLTPRMALGMISLVWIITLAAFTPLLLYFVVKDCPFGSGTVSICTLGWPRTQGVSVVVLFTSVVCGVGFIVPIVILVVSHVCIFIKVHKVRAAMRKQRHRHISTSSALLTPTLLPPTTPPPFAYPPLPQHHDPTSKSPGAAEGGGGTGVRLFLPGLLSKGGRPHLPALTSTPSTSPGPSSPASPGLAGLTTTTTATTSTLDARRRRSSRELQVVRTLVCLVLLFLLMWAPIFVVFLLIMRDAYLDVMHVSSQAFLGAMCLAYLNAVVNPLAYGLSTDRLRHYLRAGVRSCCCCCCCCCKSSSLSAGMRHGGVGEGCRGGGGSTGGGGGVGGGDGGDRMRGRVVVGGGMTMLKSSGTSVS
ncbi:uncharacterized protein LOC143301754 [Babylonia areolata]|uniref:uncharacterized protein LOC143301754 n=1 Tax=Babylonia areolata TaxID=304850 RepID=UPI003FD4E64C